MEKLRKRYFNASEQSYFLFGPRGAGKSTWLRHQYPDALIIDLLQPDICRTYQAHPEQLADVVKGSQAKIVILDEIQKVPELLSVAHQLIEEKQGWQFILTGSSARKLKRTRVNLLAGRAIIRQLHPFMAAELGQAFSLEQALQYGLIPLIVGSKDPAGSLQAYISLYLEQEVKAESFVRNVGSFARFLTVVSFSHGSLLNTSNIARECQVSRKLIEGYLEILQDLLLSFHLPVFTVRAKRKVVAHPKFYYFDVGIYKGLRESGFLDKTTEIDGAGLEGLVAQHLRAWNDYQGSPYTLYYWRTQYGVEVDFIVYGKAGLYAIEVKNSTQITPKDLKGLKAFCQDYPEATPILLYRGQVRMQKGNIVCLPVVDFLTGLCPGQLLV